MNKVSHLNFWNSTFEFEFEMAEIDNTFNDLDDNDKFIFLLSKPEAGKKTSEYINKTLELRNFLAEKPKQN